MDSKRIGSLSSLSHTELSLGKREINNVREIGRGDGVYGLIAQLVRARA